MAEAETTTDHDEIRRWVEQRNGQPARVKDTANPNSGILRINYPGYSGEEALEEIPWAEFFDIFEKNNLAFLYQDEEDSRFSKLINRPSAAGAGQPPRAFRAVTTSGMSASASFQASRNAA